MTDYTARFEKAIKDAKDQKNNDLYTIVLYWIASKSNISIGDCSHDKFVAITADARKLVKILARNYVITETADEIYLDEYSRLNGELSQFNALRLSEELNTNIRTAKNLAELLVEAMREVPHEPK